MKSKLDRVWVGLLALCWLAVLGGCPAGRLHQQRIESFATAHGMVSHLTQGQGFQHLIYTRGDLVAARRVRIYLEGDGLPWVNRHRIAPDPTPRDPLALRLMARDPLPALYVGRPCYHGLSNADRCWPWLWTQGRYSEEVVVSMLRAIERQLPPAGSRRLTLIGYSGGGVLALLIAERLQGVDSLVTIAANLDIDAWADRQGYSRLTGSLNPATRPPLEPGISQLHLIGERDDRVPPATLSRFLARNPDAGARVFRGFDHRCCWVEVWPSILR